MNREAHQRIMAARTSLILDQEFWGHLVLLLQVKEDTTCPTAWTDGTTMGYNPDFILSLSQQEVLALWAHEAAHCAFGHPWRRGGRDSGRWNEACDRVINPILRSSRFRLPEGALFELSPDHLGKSSEWVYDRLPDSPQKPQGDQGRDQGEGGSSQAGNQASNRVSRPDPSVSWGEVRDAPKPQTPPEEAGAEGKGPPEMDETAWQQAMRQAAMAAKGRGSLPGELERLLGDMQESRTDWRAALRRFVQELARNDYSWSLPNRRYAHYGLYLPALRGQEMGEIVVVVDTSGSIDKVLLAQFGAELQSITDECSPRKTTVMYADARVQGTEEFFPGDTIELKPRGGGGTSFVPAIEQIQASGELPVCLVYLTDLAGKFPAQAPEFPVLWASTNRRHTAPFGETLWVGGN